MHRVRRWLPWLVAIAVMTASRLKVPAARSAAAQLRAAAECGLVPGGTAVMMLTQSTRLAAASALPGPPSPGECASRATAAMSTSTTLGARVLVELRHQWQVFRAGWSEKTVK